MFSDSDIAKGVQLSKTTAMYGATYGIAPHLKYMLKEEISKSDVMTFLFDESLSEITQACVMYVIVCYWGEKKQKVKVRYWPTCCICQFEMWSGKRWLDSKKSFKRSLPDFT